MNVLIIQRMVPDYRASFFQRLHSRLANDGISLKVLCGVGRREEFLQDAMESMSFVTRTRNVPFLGGTYWSLDSWKMASHSDLVIVEQAVAPLQNIAFVLRREIQSLFLRDRHPLIAFWGHGTNLTENAHAIVELYRRRISRNADWWFAYTTRTQRIVAATGFPSEQITVVNNSTDVDALRANMSMVNREQADHLFQTIFPRTSWSSSLVGIFCSRLIPRKSIDLLLNSAEQIHRQLASFRLIVIGDGPLRPFVDEFCKKNSWCAYLGPVSRLKAGAYFKLADIWLCPGSVGLEVVDALAAGLPICTTDNNTHGPEIAYLSNGKNGIISVCDASRYALSIMSLLSSRSKLTRMKRQARQDSFQYGVQQMADRFHSGIVQCLSRK